MASSVNHTVRLPRWTNAASYSGQFVTRYLDFGILWRRLSLNLYGMELPELGVGSDQPTILPLSPGIPPILRPRCGSPDARNPEKALPPFSYSCTKAVIEAAREDSQPESRRSPS